MKVSHPLSPRTMLVAEVCEGAEQIGAELLQRLSVDAGKLRDGESAVVSIEWATLRLHAASAVVTVEEPDYGHAPETFIASLVKTSRIFLVQRHLLQQLKMTGQPVAAADYLTVFDDVIEATAVVGRRHLDTERTFTGWEITSTEVGGEAGHGIYSVRELAAARLELCAPLALPPDWTFRFVGKTLMECGSPTGDTHKVRLWIDV